MKKIIVGMVVCLVAVAASVAGIQSKYTTGATDVNVTFGPGSGPSLVKSINASSTDADAAIDIYGRTGSPAYLTAAATNAQLLVYVDNSDSQFASNDVVVIVYNDGAVGDSTLSTCTASNVLLVTALTQAATTDTKIYEVTQLGQINIGTTAFNEAGDAMFASPSDSPVKLVVDGTNGTITATVQK